VNVSAPFIARPVATSLIAIALMILGAIGYLKLPVASLPQVAFPTIVVSTALPGASPQTTAALITAPLERQLGQIASLASMTSTSSFGFSQITLQFALDRDIDGAAQDVQAAINAAAATLPRGIPYPPAYQKTNPADTPIMTLALTSAEAPLRLLADLADTLIAQRLSEIGGVGRVSVQGSSKPAVRVKVDVAALAALGLGFEDIRAAINRANVTAPIGALDGQWQAHSITANNQITSAAEYERITIATKSGVSVRLGEVATLVDGFENERLGAWLDGKPAIVIDIQRQPNANVVETVDRIQRLLPEIRRALPAGASLEVFSDRTGMIRASVHEVQFTLVLSVGLVVMVVLLFLRTWSATIIAGVTLPLSMVGSFAVMWLAGFSLDNLSLMALTISVGFVVDDVIVMLENIARHRERGQTGYAAAMLGSREIGFTVVSLTMSLLAVFVPLLFMGGLVGRMFSEFALTLSIAVVVSMIVSLTVTPMLAAHLLGARDRSADAPDGEGRQMHGRWRFIDWFGQIFANGYARSLGVVLRHRTLTLAVTLATVGATIWLYVAMPKGFLPAQDTGLINVALRAAPEASFAALARQQAQATTAIKALPDVAGVVAVVGVGPSNPAPNLAVITVSLKSLGERKRSAEAVADDIRAQLAILPGVTALVRTVPDVQVATRSSWNTYQYTLVGTDRQTVRRWGMALLGAVRGDATFADAGALEEDEGFESMIRIDRLRAGQFGVSQQSISDVLNSAFAQRQISTIYGHANQYRVIIEADLRHRSDPSLLGNLRVPGANNAQVPILAVADIVRGEAPLVVSHQSQFPAFTIGFDLADGRTLEDAVKQITALQRQLGVPDALTGQYSGEAAEFRASLANQPLLILAALLSIYIVLGALYESYVHPVTILSTLPSAGIGALLALLAIGEQLTVIGIIAVVLLMGIVKKNAILMIDFAIHAERDRGLSPLAAITEAAALRFRPIMMTTLAAVAGALPLALGGGPGSEFRVPLGVAIIGGLALSQVLTLYTTPVVYLALDPLRRRIDPAMKSAQTVDAPT
jgi:multidrug efflux pump